MAAEVDPRNGRFVPPYTTTVTASHPHLRVLTPDPRHQILRRRRMLRRARRLGVAALWLAGSAGLSLMVLGGIAGLH